MNVGEIPQGLIIRHKCKSKLCVNPAHLELGTYRQNSLDRFRDGTMNNKLTAENIATIRASEDSAKDIAEQYDVSLTTIYSILKRKTWTHI
jgi:DNA invertase Pin-like site-specific DNA recombinase